MRKTKRNVKFIFVLICAAALGLATNAGDVIIHLRNGDRVTGAILGETTGEVTLKSLSLGKIVIPVGQILKREEVIAPSATANAATNAAAATTTTNATTAAATTSKPVPAAVATKPTEPKHWNSELQFGLNLRYSTVDQQESLVIAKSTYAKNHFREILEYNF